MNHKALAYTLLNLTLGLNFMMHGLVRVLGDYKAFVEKIGETFSDTFLPEMLVDAYAYGLPVAELALGIVLVSGRFRPAALGFCFVLLNSLIFGSCLIQNWTNVGIQMLYVLFAFFLLFFAEYSSAGSTSIQASD